MIGFPVIILKRPPYSVGLSTAYASNPDIQKIKKAQPDWVGPF